MCSPCIEDYRGKWKNRDGFLLTIRPIDEDSASVDISVDGCPVRRPWCKDTAASNLNALYRGEEGLGLEINLGRDGFSLFLDYECADGFHEKECLTASISRLEDDQEAKQWLTHIGIETYQRLRSST